MLIDGKPACEVGGQVYVLIDVSQKEQDDIIELMQISTYLKSTKEKGIWEILYGKDQQFIFPMEGRTYCIIKKSTKHVDNRQNIGRKLGLFHHRGMMIPFAVKKINRLGKWKMYWENRLDQMEKVWTEQLQHPPENDFERLFIEAFPYYMGLTENAIQYLVDTELDEEPIISDSGTICNYRFSVNQLQTTVGWKNPFYWVLDHRARDLAEWSRSVYLQNIKMYQPNLSEFFYEYQTVLGLSPFAWRLTYARLLFPLHFLENVEEYYITTSERRKNELLETLQKILDQSDEYERFLGDFFQVAGVPVRRLNIPEVDWLKRAYK